VGTGGGPAVAVTTRSVGAGSRVGVFTFWLQDARSKLAVNARQALLIALD